METTFQSNENTSNQKTYGLSEYQFSLVEHLMKLSKEDKFFIVTRIDRVYRDYLPLEREKMLEYLDCQLQLFNKVYQEKSEFYDSIFNTVDFDIITQILSEDDYFLTQYQRYCNEINKQQNQLNILLKEIQELHPDKMKKSEKLAQQFYSPSKLSESKFAHYTNLDQEIQDNEKIIKSLKEIRFDYVF